MNPIRNDEHCKCINGVFKLSITSWALCLIPPIVPTQLPDTIHSAASTAESVITRVNTDVKEAQDNLFKAKIFQEHYANANHGFEFVYKVGDHVIFSTFNRHCEYCQKGEKQSAKFFPWWDGLQGHQSPPRVFFIYTRLAM